MSLKDSLNVLGKILESNFIHSCRNKVIKYDKNGNESIATRSYKKCFLIYDEFIIKSC